MRGVDRNRAITIISEIIGTDMSQFGSSKRLCRWAVLTPGNNESAGRKNSVPIWFNSDKELIQTYYCQPTILVCKDHKR